MAIDGNAYSPTQVRVAIAEQPTFGTAVTTQSSFYELDVRELVSYDPSTNVVTDEQVRHDGTHLPGLKDTFKTPSGATPSIQVSGVLTKERAAFLFYGVFQNVVEGESPAYQKTFTWDRDTAPVTGSSLQLYTVLIADPEDNYSMEGAVLKTLVLSIDPANSGRIAYTATFISGFPINTDETATPADWDAVDNNYYPMSSFDVKTIGLEEFVLTSFELTLENNAVRIGSSALGHCQGYAVGIGSGKGYSATGNLTVLYDGVTEGWLALSQASPAGGAADLALAFVWYDSSQSEMSLDANIVFTNASREAGGESGMTRTLPFVCTDDGTHAAIEMLVGDGVDRSW